MRLDSPEPLPGPPVIEFRPGLAAETLAELGPFLAEEGFDVDNLEVDSLDGLNAALARASERANMIRFTPVGEARSYALTVHRLVAEAIIEDEDDLAFSILASVPPEQESGVGPTVAGVIGVGLDFLDRQFKGSDSGLPSSARSRVKRLPGHWVGGRACTDVLALARKGRAYSASGSLNLTHGGQSLFYGTVLAVTSVLVVWAEATGRSVAELGLEHLTDSQE